MGAPTTFFSRLATADSAEFLGQDLEGRLQQKKTELLDLIEARPFEHPDKDFNAFVLNIQKPLYHLLRKCDRLEHLRRTPVVKSTLKGILQEIEEKHCMRYPGNGRHHNDVTGKSRIGSFLEMIRNHPFGAVVIIIFLIIMIILTYLVKARDLLGKMIPQKTVPEKSVETTMTNTPQKK